MKNVDRHEFLVAQWLQPSRGSAMPRREIARRKSPAGRFLWFMAASGLIFLGWWLLPFNTLIDFLHRM